MRNLNDMMRFLIIAIIIAVPLLFSGNLDISFELPKITFFKVTVSILILIFITWIFQQKEIALPTRPWRNGIIIGFFALVTTTILAAILSVAPNLSVFGSYERLQGILSFLHYAAFFWIVAFVIDTEEKRKQVLMATAVVGTTVAIIGILQKFGVDPFFKTWDTAFFLDRVFATLGHPNVLAGFLLLTIGATLDSKGGINAAHAAALTIQLIALFLTQSRAALIAIMGMSFFFCFFYFKNAKRFMVPIIITLLLLTSYFYFISNRTTFSDENLRSVESRTAIWQSAIEVFKNRPLFGHGLETFGFTSPKYKNAELLNAELLNETADRAHNEILDTLVQTGIIGLISYLLFLISVFYYGLKKKTNLALLTGIFGLFIFNQFNFSTTVHYVFFWLFAGMIFRETFEWKTMPRKAGRQPHRILRLVIIGFVLINSLFLTINPLLANYFYRKAIRTNVFSSLQIAEQLDPFHDEYSLSIANSYLHASPRNAGQAGLSTLTHVQNKNALYYVLLGSLLLKHGYSIQNQTVIENGIEAFEQAKNLSPYQPFILKTYGDYLLDAGLTQQAITEYEAYLALVPPYWKWTAEELAQKTDYEKTRYRQFFQDNPGFNDVFSKLSRAYEITDN